MCKQITFHGGIKSTSSQNSIISDWEELQRTTVKALLKCCKMFQAGFLGAPPEKKPKKQHFQSFFSFYLSPFCLKYYFQTNSKIFCQVENTGDLYTTTP